VKDNQASQTKSILEQIASITSMERGKLSEVYRSRPAAHGTRTIQLGPYHKLQTWENGRNLTRHVPAAEVAALKEDLANHKRFTELSAAFEEVVIARTRALRDQSPDPNHADATAAKKNSTKKRATKGSAKPRGSSRKPKRS
jgi:hypothetical protein